MEIDLLWTAVIVELRFMKSPAGIEIVGVTGIVKTTVMVLASEE